MTDLFESPKRSILRAHHHILDLESQIRDFSNDNAWSYVVEKDSDGIHDVHKIKFARRLPDDLPSILFDAVNNLRASLDQCSYASALAAKSRSLRNVKFPFAKDQAHWGNAVNGLKDLHPDIRQLFLGANAYEGGNDALWALNEICNAKKHFALIPFNVGTARLMLEIEDPEGPLMSRTGKNFRVAGFYGRVGGLIGPASGTRWNAEKYELVLLRTDHKPKVRYDAKVAISVAIDGLKLLRGKPIVGILRQISNLVARIGQETEAECRRLGFIV